MKGIRHFGIVVSNMEASLGFYRDLLGFKVEKDVVEKGEFIDKILGLAGVEVRTIKLLADDGNLIELLSYQSHKREAGERELPAIGASHPAFTVENVDETCQRLTARGIKFTAPPQVSPDGKAKVTFCFDPDGVPVELVQELKEREPNYLSVVYDEKTKPITKYPSQLCAYLFDRFRMKPEDSILDVGCGRGDFILGFKELGLKTAGIDKEKSESQLFLGTDFKTVDFEKETFPFPDNTFDFIFSKSVIEHLLNPENFIQECYRVLKPGGRIIVMTPDWQSQILIFYDDYTHQHPYTETGLSDLLKIHRFQDVDSELFYQLPVLWKYPFLKIFSKCLQLLGPVEKVHKNKFVRWSRELMILATGIKEKGRAE